MSSVDVQLWFCTARVSTDSAQIPCHVPHKVDPTAHTQKLRYRLECVLKVSSPYSKPREYSEHILTSVEIGDLWAGFLAGYNDAT